jgi:hypothetical protein
MTRVKEKNFCFDEQYMYIKTAKADEHKLNKILLTVVHSFTLFHLSRWPKDLINY